MTETTHIIALSGGKDSTALALRLRELNPGTPYRYVFTPTGSELPAMRLHWKNLECLLGAPLEQLAPESLPALIFKQRALPNPRMRWCTRLIKIEPFKAFVVAHLPAVIYVGIRADEADRGGVYGGDEGVTERHPMVEWGWSRNDVVSYLKERGITVPSRTDCAQCPFQTLGEWWLLWHHHPDEYAKAEAQEAFVTAARGREQTFRSDSRDSWPAGLKELRQRFEAGDVPIRGKTPLPEYQADMFVGEYDLMEQRRGMCRVCTL